MKPLLFSIVVAGALLFLFALGQSLFHLCTLPLGLFLRLGLQGAPERAWPILSLLYQCIDCIRRHRENASLIDLRLTDTAQRILAQREPLGRVRDLATQAIFQDQATIVPLKSASSPCKMICFNTLHVN